MCQAALLQKDLYQDCPRACSNSHLWFFWRQKCYCCSLRWQWSRTEAWANSPPQWSPTHVTKAPILHAAWRTSSPAPFSNSAGITSYTSPPVTLSSWCKGDTETLSGGDQRCATAPTVCQIRNTLHYKAAAGLRPAFLNISKLVCV